jgi:hypothetical protein
MPPNRRFISPTFPPAWQMGESPLRVTTTTTSGSTAATAWESLQREITSTGNFDREISASFYDQPIFRAPVGQGRFRIIEAPGHWLNVLQLKQIAIDGGSVWRAEFISEDRRFIARKHQILSISGPNEGAYIIKTLYRDQGSLMKLNTAFLCFTATMREAQLECDMYNNEELLRGEFHV